MLIGVPTPKSMLSLEIATTRDSYLSKLKALRRPAIKKLFISLFGPAFPKPFNYPFFFWNVY